MDQKDSMIIEGPNNHNRLDFKNRLYIIWLNHATSKSCVLWQK